mmetsp:Transcript_59532/g.159497  ORF Transcript_59532/g.159497 Transcript_59532/m.159497 type:complete len:231 (-) Transcript_59532:131-823(-)
MIVTRGPPVQVAAGAARVAFDPAVRARWQHRRSCGRGGLFQRWRGGTRGLHTQRRRRLLCRRFREWSAGNARHRRCRRRHDRGGGGTRQLGDGLHKLAARDGAVAVAVDGREEVHPCLQIRGHGRVRRVGLVQPDGARGDVAHEAVLGGSLPDRYAVRARLSPGARDHPAEVGAGHALEALHVDLVADLEGSGTGRDNLQERDSIVRRAQHIRSDGDNRAQQQLSWQQPW